MTSLTHKMEGGPRLHVLICDNRVAKPMPGNTTFPQAEKKLARDLGLSETSLFVHTFAAFTRPNVQVKNVCSGYEWKGYRTKIVAAAEYLAKWHAPSDEDLVMFLDAPDSIINGPIDPVEIERRFAAAATDAMGFGPSPGKIIFQTEAFPSFLSPRQRSRWRHIESVLPVSCHRYINSGAVIARARDMRSFCRAWADEPGDTASSVWTDQFASAQLLQRANGTIRIDVREWLFGAGVSAPLPPYQRHAAVPSIGYWPLVPSHWRQGGKQRLVRSKEEISRCRCRAPRLRIRPPTAPEPSRRRTCAGPSDVWQARAAWPCGHPLQRASQGADAGQHRLRRVCARQPRMASRRKEAAQSPGRQCRCVWAATLRARLVSMQCAFADAAHLL